MTHTGLAQWLAISQVVLASGVIGFRSYPATWFGEAKVPGARLVRARCADVSLNEISPGVLTSDRIWKRIYESESGLSLMQPTIVPLLRQAAALDQPNCISIMTYLDLIEVASGCPTSSLSKLVRNRGAESQDHHLWNNRGTWWCHFTLHHPDFTSQRIRLSLKTRDLGEARERRDELFACFS